MKASLRNRIKIEMRPNYVGLCQFLGRVSGHDLFETLCFIGPGVFVRNIPIESFPVLFLDEALISGLSLLFLGSLLFLRPQAVCEILFEYLKVHCVLLEAVQESAELILEVAPH